MEVSSLLAMDSRGIEPRTTPRFISRASEAQETVLREYYTTKPQARVIG